MVVTSSAVSRRESRSGGGAGQAHPGGAARRDARRADALPLRHRRGRHAWQDHDHQPHLIDSRRGRRGSHLRDRWPPQERRHQCAPRRRQVPGGRGRRERRLVPASEPDDRHRHQHRQRSPRDASTATSSSSRRASSPSCTTCRSTGSRCCAWTIRTCAASCRRSTARWWVTASRRRRPARREPAPRGIEDPLRRGAARRRPATFR